MDLCQSSGFFKNNWMDVTEFTANGKRVIVRRRTNLPPSGSPALLGQPRGNIRVNGNILSSLARLIKPSLV